MTTQNPIYKPRGPAGEYAELALNIYTECPHGCPYCYARMMAKRFGKPWTGDVRPREGIVEATRKQLASGKHEDKTIFLCFTCDPYPIGYDTTVTREIISLIKEAGCHVQILTKGDRDISRDFDLLDGNDWFGVTYTGSTRYAEAANGSWVAESGLLFELLEAAREGINTWVSIEPVLNAKRVYNLIETGNYIDHFYIGKLNYHPSDINWGEFGKKCERLCIQHDRNYIIKEALRKEMEKQ